MSYSLSTVEEALSLPFERECSIAVRIVTIGETITYVNQKKEERSYYVLKVADKKNLTYIRNYQTRSRSLVVEGKTYAFLKVIRKSGEESFWTTRNTNIIAWAQFEVPEEVLEQDPRGQTSRNNSVRKLSQAIQSSSTSVVKGKVVQTSPKDHRRNGELTIKFVSLKDDLNEPAVKIALFNEEAETQYNIGDVISVTDTYRYNQSNSLSTKGSSKVEFHPSNSIPFDVSEKDFLSDEDFTRSYEPPVTCSFTVMGIATTTLYPCCTNPACHHKKLKNDTCEKCKKTTTGTPGYYCTADILVLKGTNVSRHTIFHPDLKKLIPELSELSFFKENRAELTAFVSERLPLNGKGNFTNNNLTVISSKRRIPDMEWITTTYCLPLAVTLNSIHLNTSFFG